MEGTITNVTHCGAFPEVEEGLEGLIRLLDMMDGAGADPPGVLVKGDRVSAASSSLMPYVGEWY